MDDASDGKIQTHKFDFWMLSLHWRSSDYVHEGGLSTSATVDQYRKHTSWTTILMISHLHL